MATPLRLRRRAGAPPNPWTQMASMPLGRALVNLVPIGAKLYLPGGYGGSGIGAQNTLYEWDQGSNTWSTKATKPAPLYSTGSAAIGTKLYVAGGTSGSGTENTLFEWDQGSNTWSTKATMPGARTVSGSAAIGTKLYVAGGTDGSFAFRDTLFEWDQGSNTWSTKAAMPVTSGQAALCSIGTKLYVADTGVGTGGSAGLYEWDQGSNTWSTKAAPPETVEWATAIGSDIFGGPGQVTHKKVMKWSGGIWSIVNTAYPGVGVDNSGAASLGTLLYVAGGTDFSSSVSTMYRYTT